MRARDKLDFYGIKKAVDAVSGSDPIWLLRQASLRCELGDLDEARKLILKALTELRVRQRVSRKSLWVCSRLAWAEWLARAVERDSVVAHNTEKWPSKFEEAECDPFDALAQIKSDADRIREEQEKDRRIIPQFKPGYYRDPSKTIHFQSSTVVSPATTLEMLMETVGLPMQFQHVALAVEPSKNAIVLNFAATTKNYVQLLRVVGDESDPLIVRYLGRIALASLPADVVATLTTKVLGAVHYWTERVHDNRIHVKGFAIGRLRVFVECLARLAVCSAEGQVLAIFDLAMDLARDPSFRHHRLVEVLDHLVEFTAQAAPPAERARVILALLEFPLSSEKGIGDVRGPLRWPNPIGHMEGTSSTRPMGDTCWDTCIHRLIQSAGAGNPNREIATSRLTYLAGQQLLSHTEREAFKATLWSETDHFEASLPAGTNLLPHVFAFLPAPDEIDISARVRARIFKQVNSVVDKSLPQGQAEAQLKTIVGAASGYGGCERMLPTRDEALILFNQMASWRPNPQPKALDFADAFASAMGLEEHISQWIGVALERSVVPAFPAKDLTAERAQTVLSLIEEGSVSTAIAALPYFTRVAVVLPDILRIVRRAIIGRQSNEVHGGTSAVTNWATLARNGNIDPLPRALIEQVIYAIETRHEVGLADLLKCARSLLEEELLTEEDIARLDDALGKSYDRNRLQAN